MSSARRWTLDEVRLAARAVRCAVEDKELDQTEWFRPEFLTEEIAPMLDLLANMLGENAPYYCGRCGRSMSVHPLNGPCPTKSIVRCPSCDGKGFAAGNPYPCQNCHGSGLRASL